MIPAILLAAGESRRMGRVKQLLPWHGQPLVRHMAEMVLSSDADELVVVVGSHAPEVVQALEGLHLLTALNPDYATGQASSLQTGLHTLPPTAEAALIVLVDQPLIPATLLNSLIATFRRTGAPLVVPRYRGQRGTPVVLGRTMFAEALALQGDTGARVLLQRYANQIAWLEVDDEAVIIDMDSPAAYERLSIASQGMVEPRSKE